MQFSVPTNWTDELIFRIGNYPVSELYGALPVTPVGSGRSTKILPQIDKEKAKAHVRRTLDNGWGFNYLLNGVCLGNRETSPAFREALYNHLVWAVASGITSVTVANLFLLDFIKTHFPGLSIKTSIFMAPINVSTIKKLAQLGASAIAIKQGDNRNFEFLKKAKQAVDAELWLLANVACAYDCPSLTYHANASGHDSCGDEQLKSGANTYPILSCTANKLTDAPGLVRARWIRPEDLSVYEAHGYHSFKIAGRDAPTEWIEKVLGAYAARRYDGNLTDILDGYHYLNSWQRRMGNMQFRLPLLDNQKLNGFINYFSEGHCSELCDDCGYCQQASERAVTMFHGENQSFIDVIGAYAESKRYF